MFSWVAFQLCLKIYCPYHTQSPIIDPLTVDFKSSLVFLNTKHWSVSIICFLHLIVLYFPVFSNLLSFPVPIQAWVKVQSCSRAMERHVSDFAHNKIAFATAKCTWPSCPVCLCRHMSVLMYTCTHVTVCTVILYTYVS